MQQLNAALDAGLAALDAGLACQSFRARGWKCLRDRLRDPAQVEVGDLAERVGRGPRPRLDHVCVMAKRCVRQKNPMAGSRVRRRAWSLLSEGVR